MWNLHMFGIEIYTVGT